MKAKQARGETADPGGVAKSRRPSRDSRAAAKLRTDALRERMRTTRQFSVGTVLNKEPGWSYSWIAKDASPRVRDLSRLDLETKGYEKHTAGIVTVAGCVDAEIWQVPTEIAVTLRDIRNERVRARDRANQQQNILRR